MKRIPAHVTETKAKDYVRKQINSFYENGDALYRDLTERDYGVDAIIELFQNGTPTGQLALLQIKGTNNKIVPLKTHPEKFSCSISTSNALYSLQKNIPVILIYVYLGNLTELYYVNIQDALKEIQLEKLYRQDTITVHIPLKNRQSEDMEPLFQHVRNFYS